MTQVTITTLFANRPGSLLDHPFGDEADVYKVGGKVYAIVRPDGDPPRISLKCDPQFAIELRAQYPNTIVPGYRLNKVHWNTILLNGALPDGELLDLVDHSYSLVLNSLTRSVRSQIGMTGDDGTV